MRANIFIVFLKVDGTKSNEKESDGQEQRLVLNNKASLD